MRPSLARSFLAATVFAETASTCGPPDPWFRISNSVINWPMRGRQASIANMTTPAAHQTDSDQEAANPRRDAQRAALLDAASRMLMHGGPDAISLRKLAAEVGTSTMAVYT